MTSEVYEQELAKVQGQFGMDKFKKGWFSEPAHILGDLATSVRVDKILYHEKSKYQDICIFESSAYGRALVLDHTIQMTEKDEWACQEMLSFIALNSHPNPKKVLINGGGVGGTLREVTKHPLVESIEVCEIDEAVIEASKKYLPFMAKGFDSPKYTLHVEDGAEYVKRNKGEFDIIITDAPDPKGPGKSLYARSYYKSLKEALKPGGIIVSQAECFWVDLPIIKELVSMSKEIFPVVDLAVFYIGSYPGGNIAYLLCGTSPSTNFRKPIHKFSLKDLKDMGLKYYTPDIHKASTTLPLFLAKELGLKWEI